MKTETQKAANTFDLALYRLIVRAERGGKAWYEVAARLRSARAYVRELMHPEDRKGTEG